MFKVRDNMTNMPQFKNKEEIKVANHRDDGDLRTLRLEENNGKAKVFSFSTMFELMAQLRTKSIDVCIAEDYFWTAMPFMTEDGLVNYNEILSQIVLASVWGTPAIIDSNTGNMYACYFEVNKEEFPGVYMKEWNKEFCEKYIQGELDKTESIINKLLEELK